MDEQTIKDLIRLAPRLMQPVLSCAMMLDRIAALQPVGRRALALRLHLSEREVRSLAEELRENGYIKIEASGMELTSAAEDALKTARALVRGMRELSVLESQLAHLLSIARVIVVAGDADENEKVLEEMGRATAVPLRQMLYDGAILAVTGGTTIATVARMIPHGSPMDIQVLPARGGFGRAVETQADTLAAEFAHKFGGHHRLMHMPDSLTPEMQREMMKLPEIREICELLLKTNVLIYGVGRADDMARNRRMSSDDFNKLRQRGAVAEAFGFYFDEQGRSVQSAASVGLSLDNIESLGHIIAVAGGKRKAAAILAVTRHHRHDLLVTDEGAARQILNILHNNLASTHADMV